ncbi:MAG: hypothetical protein JWL59_4809 [Chthoniobacteraceae bacterium]|nr:hypothetical protein [Chthoniobacteraceae bacterium]
MLRFAVNPLLARLSPNMKANSYDIWTLFSERRFRIPLYQRHYDWSESQCAALWEDFIRLCENSKVNHYLGTMVVVARHNEVFEIVDGQQRATSLMLLFKALQGYFNECDLRRLTHLQSSDLQVPELRLLSQGKGRGMGSEFDRFSAAMYSKEGDGPAQPEITNFSRNLEFFRHSLHEHQKAVPAAQRLTFETIRNGLTRMCVALVELEPQGDDKDSPQTIFEKMNAEGKNLEVHDLIRNYVFMLAAESTGEPAVDAKADDIASARQQSLYLNEWQNFESEFSGRAFDQMRHFFRDYLIIETGDVKLTSGPELYKKFKEKFAVRSPTVGAVAPELLSDFRGVEKLANDLWKYADAWNKVVFEIPVQGTSSHTARLRQLLNEFGLISNAPYYPFATLLMVQDQADHEKLVNLFKILNKFIAISRITDTHVPFGTRFLKPLLDTKTVSDRVLDFLRNPSSLQKQLCALWPNGFDPEASMRKALTGNWAVEYGVSGSQSDIEVGSLAQTQEQELDAEGDASLRITHELDVNAENPPPDLYHLDSRTTTYMLLKINEQIMRATGDTAVEYLQPSHSLEHIMPQTRTKAGWPTLDGAFYERYLHSLGNLTLIGKGFNSVISNKSLEEKIVYYERSSYAITRRLAGELRRDCMFKADSMQKADMKKLAEFIQIRTLQLAEEAIAVFRF